MKKLYTDTIIGSSGRGCVLIILFQLYGSKAGLFEGNLFLVGQYKPRPHPQPQASCMSKFWYTYVITYNDFMVIVKPCVLKILLVPIPVNKDLE